MIVDKALSRFKIRTKVLIFVLPFVASISAVGLTGLYTTGMLQSRMEISNGVLRSLSGFKELYAALDHFLFSPNTDTRDVVLGNLVSQKGVLSDALDQLEPGAVGRDELQATIDGIESINTIFGELWNLHLSADEARSSIKSSTRGLADARKKIVTDGENLRAQLNSEQEAAEGELRAAAHLSEAGDFLSETINKFMRAKQTDEKFAFVQGVLPQLSAVEGKIVGSLPKSRESTGELISDGLKELKSIYAEPERKPQHLLKLTTAFAKFRQAAVSLQLGAVEKMKEATNQFAALDEQVTRTQTILNDINALTFAIYDLQIEQTRFLADPKDETLKNVETRLSVVEKGNDTLVSDAGDFYDTAAVGKTVTAATDDIKKSAANLVTAETTRQERFEIASTKVDEVWIKLSRFAELQKDAAGDESKRANGTSIFATVLGVLVALLGGIALIITLQGPLGRITAAMRKLAEGSLETSVEGDARQDEIGEMARALDVFKTNALEKLRVEAESQDQQQAAEQERLRNDKDRQAREEEVAYAVMKLGAGLERLSLGDLATEIEEPFIGELDRLRKDYNLSLSRLRETMLTISENAKAIQANGGEMRGSADDLAKRTETQAASLEETAAAVDEITTTVRQTAMRAEDANKIVGSAREKADASMTVVANAVDAMSRIEDASGQIEQIIDVIEDIAFQTNLLALNAGIEAARAGEAGKGFAVVAMEVRELAQRSAGAAQDIKGLIEAASREVASGVTNVQQTGDALGGIAEQISALTGHIEMITSAARDQAASLNEVNGTVNHMDQMTQANAAMVEETNALSQQLADDANQLMQLVSQFILSRSAKTNAQIEAA